MTDLPKTIVWGETPKQVDVNWGENFSYQGNDTPTSTVNWEVAFQFGEPDAVKLFETIDKKTLGRYYKQRSEKFSSIVDQGLEVEDDAVENYDEVGRALLSDGSDEQLTKNAEVTLNVLQANENRYQHSPKQLHSLSEIHEKAKSFLV